MAHSTCQTKYMAIIFATKQYIWILRGLNYILDKYIPAAIDLAHNPKLNDTSKHIDTIFHFTRMKVENGSLTLLHIPSSENVADLCTKALPGPRLRHLCAYIFGTK